MRTNGFPFSARKGRLRMEREMLGTMMSLLDAEVEIDCQILLNCNIT